MARRRSSRRTSDSYSVTSILIAVLSFGGIATFVTYLSLNQPNQLDEFGCPIDTSAISENIVFVFDTTEPYVDSQSREITNRVRNIMQNADSSTRISAVEIVSDSSSAVNVVPLGEQQYPYLCPLDTGINTANIIERFYENLISSIGESVLDNVSPEEQPYSRLIDGLRYVASDAAGRNYTSKIYIFSDMIEHSQSISMYRSNWFEQEFKPNEVTLKSQRPLFPTNSELEIYLLARPQYSINQTELKEFWTQMLTVRDANGFVLPVFNLVSGGL